MYAVIKINTKTDNYKCMPRLFNTIKEAEELIQSYCYHHPYASSLFSIANVDILKNYRPTMLPEEDTSISLVD